MERQADADLAMGFKLELDLGYLIETVSNSLPAWRHEGLWVGCKGMSVASCCFCNLYSLHILLDVEADRTGSRPEYSCICVTSDRRDASLAAAMQPVSGLVPRY